jgi:hypothetical protein
MVLEVMTLHRLFRLGAAKVRTTPWKHNGFAAAASATSGNHRWMSGEAQKRRNIGISAHIDRYVELVFRLLFALSLLIVI